MKSIMALFLFTSVFALCLCSYADAAVLNQEAAFAFSPLVSDCQGTRSMDQQGWQYRLEIKNLAAGSSSDAYIPCYKGDYDAHGKAIVFRWCPPTSPWTATNQTRNFCYSTSDACARAEMPQSWCIKCGSP